MKILFLLFTAALPLIAIGADVAHRESFVIVLKPTGRHCETYYSLHAAELICRNDIEYKRQFRVTYRFDGKNITADLDWIPDKNFAVTSDGTPINPDTSNQYKTESQP